MLNRLHSLTLCSLMFTSTSAFAQAFTDPLGVQMWTWRNIVKEQGIDKTLDMIKDLGFTLVEGKETYGKTPEEYKKLLDARGLTLASYDVDYQKLVDNPQAIADQAKVMGASYVMVAWIPHDNNTFTFVNASKAVEDFTKAGKVLTANGLKLMYHAHGYEIVPHGNGTLLDYLLTNTDPAYVNFQMDIYWIQFGGGNPAQLLRSYPGRWLSMHIKDLRKGTLKDHTGLTSIDNDVVVGTGEIDIPGTLKAAKETGMQLFFIEDESRDPVKQVPQSVKYLRGLTL
jgi:sugar phosphate isomerase/epimerase